MKILKLLICVYLLLLHPITAQSVQHGLDVAQTYNFDLLQGKRIGLITNHTAHLSTGESIIDVMFAKTQLVALFGPEHGLRGVAEAGDVVANGRDVKTGLPIYSLYGNTKKPTPQMLQNVEALVFDMQDIGARFYTYISTMGLAMQAAAEKDIPFYVLDRPNPLGGNMVSGWVLETPFQSFVGQYAIPIQHGMSVGELARMIKGERFLRGLDALDLQVIPALGWQRTMRFPQYGTNWIAPSPNIPDFETALVYPGTCLFEGTTLSEGRGTLSPFKMIGAPWANATRLAQTLNAKQLPGVHFEATEFTPQDISGMATDPKLEGRRLKGVKILVQNINTYQPVEVGIHLLSAFYNQATSSQKQTFFKSEWLGKLAGTQRLYQQLRRGVSPQAIIANWQAEVAQFTAKRQPYLIY